MFFKLRSGQKDIAKQSQCVGPILGWESGENGGLMVNEKLRKNTSIKLYQSKYIPNDSQSNIYHLAISNQLPYPCNMGLWQNPTPHPPLNH